jgi:SPW repeat-containing protein
MNRVSWTNLALGLWLVAAGFVLKHATGNAIVEDVITGLLVALAALWAARAYRPGVSRAASWTVALTGLWIAAAPFALGYERASLAVANDVIVGLVILTLAWTRLLAYGRRDASDGLRQEPARATPR